MSEFIDDRFLKIAKLQNLLHAGNNNKSTIEYLNELKDLIEKAPEPRAKYCNYDIIEDLENEIIFDFDQQKNQKSFSINDEEITLHLNVKNLFEDGGQHILVQMFEMNTVSYYRDKLKQFDVRMNLDGLTSKYKLKIPIKSDENEMLNKYQIKQYKILFPQELLHKRGVYIIDCIFNGYQARAMIKIGDIKYIERLTSAGHCFTFFDENNKLIEPKETRLNIWMDGHIYRPKLENNNQIYIPFTTSGNNEQNQPIIIQREDDPTFNVLSCFNHSKEKYSCDFDIFMDREQLLEKQRVKILIRGAIYIKSAIDSKKKQIPLSLLEDVKLNVNINTGQDVDVDKVFEDLKLKDAKETAVSFIVPTKTRKINLKLSGFIKLIHSTRTGESGKQSMEFNKTIEINHIEDTKKFGAFYLNKSENDDYVICLLGKNGEGISNILCDLQLQHRYFKKSFEYTLKSDDNGRIYLPKLKEFISVNIKLKYPKDMNLITQNSFNLKASESRSDGIKTYYLSEGDSLDIDVNIEQDTIQDADFALFDIIYSKNYGKEYVSFSDDGYLRVSNLSEGKFILSSLHSDIPNMKFIVLPREVQAIPTKRDEEIKSDEQHQQEETKEEEGRNKTDNESSSELALYKQYYMQLSPNRPLKVTSIVKYY